MSSEYDPLFMILDFIINMVDFTLDTYEKKYEEVYPKLIKQLELKDMSLYTIIELDNEEDAFYDSDYDSDFEFFSEYVLL